LHSAITDSNAAIIEFRLKPAQADMALSGYALADPILMWFKNAAAVAAHLADRYVARLAQFVSPAHRSRTANQECFCSPARTMLQAKPRRPPTQIEGIVLAHRCQPPSGQHLESHL
jgi:hypothetical protein